MMAKTVHHAPIRTFQTNTIRGKLKQLILTFSCLQIYLFSQEQCSNKKLTKKSFIFWNMLFRQPVVCNLQEIFIIRSVGEIFKSINCSLALIVRKLAVSIKRLPSPALWSQKCNQQIFVMIKTEIKSFTFLIQIQSTSNPRTPQQISPLSPSRHSQPRMNLRCKASLFQSVVGTSCPQQRVVKIRMMSDSLSMKC